jgi:dephospho-CoA kinase
MKSFKQYIVEMQELAEKLLVIGKGKKYGQIIFLAGGAGSGKGFSVKNFLEGEKFKVRDVDEMKKLFLRLANLKNKNCKNCSELRGLDMTKPKDVYKLHMWVKEQGFKDKTLDLLLSQASSDRLPNIIFDVTMKDKNDITDVVPLLASIGYDPKNINIVWILTNYSVAIEQNRDPERGRVVPENIMLQTHEGAANTIWSFVKKGTPTNVNGGVYIILGGPKNTILWTDKKGKPIKTGKDKTVVVKDFKYITVKEPGKRMTTSKDLHNTVLEWIRQNVPISKATKHLFGSGRKE